MGVSWDMENGRCVTSDHEMVVTANQTNRSRVQELPNFVVGRKISVITSVNGITTARVPSVIVKDENIEFNSDGASTFSSVSLPKARSPSAEGAFDFRRKFQFLPKTVRFVEG